MPLAQRRKRLGPGEAPSLTFAQRLGQQEEQQAASSSGGGNGGGNGTWATSGACAFLTCPPFPAAATRRYLGNERSMLLQNTLFRCGGAAMVMSNRRKDSLRAKFKLLHTLRKQGVDDESYE